MAILDDLGLRGLNSELDRPAPNPGVSIIPSITLVEREVRRDVATIHTAPQESRCERHPDHPADDCPECKGYEVRRG